jgi:hypothetical protein
MQRNNSNVSAYYNDVNDPYSGTSSPMNEGYKCEFTTGIRPNTWKNIPICVCEAMERIVNEFENVN